MVGSVPKYKGISFRKLRQSLLAYFFGELDVEIAQRLESEEQAVIEGESSVIDVYLVDDMVVLSVVLGYFEDIALVIVDDVIGCVMRLHLSR